MNTTVMPERLVFKKDKDGTKEEFQGFISWIQSAQGKGFPIHSMMKSLVDELYRPELPSFFKEEIPVWDVDHKETVQVDEGVYAYTVTFEAIVEGELVRFSLSDEEVNPSIEAITNMKRIMELAANLAINGLRTPIGIVEEYMALTTYLPWG